MRKVTHELKTLPEHFNNVLAGIKPFEVRNDDRNFQVGDDVLLKEYIPEIGFTGRWIEAGILLKLKNEYCREGYCVFSLHLIRVGGAEFTNHQSILNMELEQLAEWLYAFAIGNRTNDLSDRQKQIKGLEEFLKSTSILTNWRK